MEIIIRDAAFPIVKDLMSILHGDVVEVAETIGALYKKITGVSDQIFFAKFTLFLKCGFGMDASELRKFSAKLAEDESFQSGFRILNIIDQIRSLDSIKYISNATRAFLYCYIDKEMYFRLCGVIVNLLPEDVDFIIENHGNRDMKYTYSAVALESNQLIYKSVMGDDARCCFLPLEDILYKYVLTYDDR